MKRKLFAALALSATLAMGTVPAFAADEDATTPTDIDLKTGQSTVVSVKTEVTQISATIPTKVLISVDMNSGVVGVPGSDKYKIVNNSIFPLKIKTVAATTGRDWEFKANSIENPGVPTAGKVGDIYMTIKPGDSSSSASPFILTSQVPFKPGDDWVVPAATTATGTTTPGELGLTLAGNASKLTASFDASKPSEAMTIAYTVGV